MKHQYQTSGFTLVELLVVIAIIGILSSVVLVSLSGARLKAKDIKIISDVKQIRSVLETDYVNANYPDLTNTTPIYGGFVTSGNPGTSTLNQFITDAATQGGAINVVNTPSGAGTLVTGYAVYGRLISSSTQYFCSDSIGNTNLNAPSNTNQTCP